MENDILDTEEFYELMQQYRHCRMANQDLVTERFEKVKTFIRNNFVEREATNAIQRMLDLFSHK